MRLTFPTSAAALLAALALPALALPPGAFAQAAPAASPAAPSQDEAPVLTPAQRTQRVEDHITQLHDELAITAAQQPHWDQFARVMRDNAANMAKIFDRRGARLDTMNAADNMQSFADVAVQHAQDIQRLATAFQSLYDSLSPGQKQTADTLFRDGAGPRRKR